MLGFQSRFPAPRVPKVQMALRITVGRPKTDPEKPSDTYLPIRVMDKGERVGGAILFREDVPGIGPIARIEAVSLWPEYRGKGIGTRIYEAAAAAACAKLRAPLGSAGFRTAMSEGFWKKQMAKGRATRTVVQKKRAKGTRRQVVYLLSCPAPKSLKGVR